MKIYIDFDGTLYNSNKLDQRFINIFKKYNIDKQYLEKLINDIKNYNLIAKKLIKDFNIQEDIIPKINNMYSSDLVFKDTIPFLEKYYQKHHLILLTYTNDTKYQKLKINSSNLNKYFKDIIITTKDKSKLDNVDYLNGVFIDNNVLELEKFYNSNAKYLLRIKRQTDKYSKFKLNIKNIPEFKDFEEIINNNYIEMIGDEIDE